MVYPKLVAGKDLQDPNIDVKTNEWYSWYCEIQTKLQKQQDENNKVDDDILRRQNRYIERE